ncbi:hypothetical protein RI367_007163 [Sorochytrium milnesiophthora]
MRFFLTLLCFAALAWSASGAAVYKRNNDVDPSNEAGGSLFPDLAAWLSCIDSQIPDNNVQKITQKLQKTLADTSDLLHQLEAALNSMSSNNAAHPKDMCLATSSSAQQDALIQIMNAEYTTQILFSGSASYVATDQALQQIQSFQLHLEQAQSEINQGKAQRNGGEVPPAAGSSKVAASDSPAFDSSNNKVISHDSANTRGNSPAYISKDSSADIGKDSPANTKEDFSADTNAGSSADPSLLKDAGDIRVGYYASWAAGHGTSYNPGTIDASKYTHVIYAFAAFTADFKMTDLTEGELQAYNAIMARAPSTRRILSIGGWKFNEKESIKTKTLFSSMCSTQDNIKTFVGSLVDFMTNHSFSGFNLDWEYPGDADRGGNVNDKNNLVNLAKTLRSQFSGKGWTLSMAVPAGISNMAGYDWSSLHPLVDWFEVMTYDYHGSWDNPLVFQPHTSIQDVEKTIEHYISSAKVPTNKLLLGLVFYGRQYVLAKSKSTPGMCELGDPKYTMGCAVSVPTFKSTVLADCNSIALSDIQEVIQTNTDVTQGYDNITQTAFIKYKRASGESIWITYDNKKALDAKVQLVKDKGLRGYFTWTIDTDMDAFGKESYLKALNGQTLPDATLPAY